MSVWKVHTNRIVAKEAGSSARKTKVDKLTKGMLKERERDKREEKRKRERERERENH